MTGTRKIKFKCKGKNLSPLQVSKTGIPNSRLVVESSEFVKFCNKTT